jgi:hypothetical protein
MEKKKEKQKKKKKTRPKNAPSATISTTSSSVGSWPSSRRVSRSSQMSIAPEPSASDFSKAALARSLSLSDKKEAIGSEKKSTKKNKTKREKKKSRALKFELFFSFSLLFQTFLGLIDHHSGNRNPSIALTSSIFQASQIAHTHVVVRNPVK